MAQTMISPPNKAVAFRGEAKLSKRAKKVAQRLSKGGHISEKALKKVAGE